MSFYFDSAIHKNGLIESITYDANNRPQDYKANQPWGWTYYYSGSNTQPDSVVGVNKDGSNFQDYYIYNTNKDLIKYSSYYNYSGTRSLYEEQVYTYNSLNQVLTFTSLYTSYTNTYDVNNMLISTLTTIGTVNYRLDSYQYTASNDLKTDSAFLWASGSWQLDNVHHYTFDASHNMLVDSIVFFNTGTARNGMKISCTYNSYSQPLTKLYEEWNTTLNAWGKNNGNDSLRTYQYQLYYPTGISNARADNNILSLYPIPATNYINIIMEHVNASHITFSVTDITGRLFKQWTSPVNDKYNFTMPVNDLLEGTYILKATSDKMVFTKQFIVLH